jgi:hypothetical protein
LRRHLPLFLLLALLFGSAVAVMAQAEHRTPFTGTWNLNIAFQGGRRVDVPDVRPPRHLASVRHLSGTTLPHSGRCKETLPDDHAISICSEP